MGPDFGGIAEDSRIDDDEAVADTRLVIEGAALVRGVAHGKYGGKQFADHAPAIAFVAAGFLARAAERHNATALLADDVREYVGGVGGGLALGVKGPDGGRGSPFLL